MRKELSERYALAQELLSRSGFFVRTGSGGHGIIASGVGFAYAAQVVQELGLEDRVSLLQIGAYPIPEAILRDFLDSVESVLVVEELTPFVEDWVTATGYRSGRMIPIYGKHTGHLPVEFEYNPDLVEDAVRSYMGLEKRPQRGFDAPPLPARPPVLCPGCPHRASFYMVKKVFGKRTVYSNDIGCYTLGYGPPLDACDLVLCMGASITQASAIARTTGKRTVAFIGDSTFFHSGLPGLANAVQNGDDVTVVVLNNRVTAMTGFQPSFAVGEDDWGKSAPGLSIAKAARGLGVEEIYTIDPFDEESALPALRKAKAGEGVNAVICDSPCVVHGKRLGVPTRHEPYTIDQELCNQCSLCVRLLGCPAIHVDGDLYTIDPDLCDGCGLCLRVCKHEAIKG
jgi:indolepyruvate ferredoxin oxidoreductase alpha subunit